MANSVSMRIDFISNPNTTFTNYISTTIRATVKE